MWLGAWPSQDMQNLERSLQDVARLVRSRTRLGQTRQGALSRFLVIRACGFLEQILVECSRAYFLSKSEERVYSFGVSWLGRGMNPSTERLISFANRLGPARASELREMLDADDQHLSSELSLLVDRRNKIAHGLSQGIGARKALDLATAVIITANWFISLFDNR